MVDCLSALASPLRQRHVETRSLALPRPSLLPMINFLHFAVLRARELREGKTQFAAIGDDGDRADCDDRDVR